MFEDMENIMEGKNTDKTLEEILPNVDIDNIITNLKLYTNDAEMLTSLYTDILLDDNVLYILTKISQQMIFMEHFPEFYSKNENSENVINCQQNSPYHRYGVFKHTLYTIEHVGNNNPKLNLNDIRLLKWTMLLHDIGKPMVKVTNEEGKDSFAGHDDASVGIASVILDRFNFDDFEKKTILTLIKYHDRYLNEGEITYDNLKFLAAELDNKPNLFNLLIEVKIADNKAKSIDVYNKFMIVVKKYYEFANEYFTSEDYSEVETEIINNTQDNNQIETSQNTFKEVSEPQKQEDPLKREIKADELQIKLKDSNEITDEEFQKIYKTIMDGKGIKYTFQPIIELNKKQIFAYEIKPYLGLGKDITMEKVLKKSKELKKYERILQLLFINTLEMWMSSKKDKMAFLKFDFPSYDSYVNKSRIFDILDNTKITIEFNNYMKYNIIQLKDTINKIRTGRGSVLLDNYRNNTLDIRSLDIIKPDYIKYDLPRGEIDEVTIDYIKDLLTYCTSSETRLVINHVDDEKKFELVKECGADLVQGEYCVKASTNINFIEIDLKKEENII